ncbi:glycoside hydrolase family 3 C-terminal domain-containing protein [uncultured Bacteroides sp.]|uniref:glycoside hydrolase family 3 C-terminal domain-containing protein n=1 Tax=uncultured Bacteroides sp. TaxID=162156 RepID=UPI002592A2BF|nr:glycoside hydrolase family 3 C-terminal domain-containing protein [uncultured Bacteroides sp.]
MQVRNLIVGALLFSCTGHVNAQSLTLRVDNIDQIVDSMTLEEKVNLLVGRNDYLFGGYEKLDKAPRVMDSSISGFTQVIPRLGIPATGLADGPAGAVVVTRPDSKKNYYATGFPIGSLLACSWNTGLVETIGQAIGNEILEYGVDVVLAPGMNIHRSPLCGRNYEYFSEDPVLTGKIAAAYIRGVQSNSVGACPKHFAVNSQETNRTEVNEIVSQRALREIYLKGFEIAVKESHPWTIMSSYNRLNGPYTQENYELLTTVLRDEWGFDGIVMSDWIRLRNTAAQIHAGNDHLQPGEQKQVDDLLDKVKTNQLSVADIDICVKRMLNYIVKTPHFRGYKYSDNPNLKAHALLARQSAAEGMVLLKNDNGALPLRNVKKVALFGCTSYNFWAGGTGSGNVVKPYVVNMQQGLNNAEFETTGNLEELYNKYLDYQRAKNRCDHGKSQGYYGEEKDILEMPISKDCIVYQAKEADVAIFTIGRQAGEGNDRTIENDFNLSEVEQNLLSDLCNAFHALDKKVIVVLNVGGVVETASWKSLPDAILLAWQPGQEGGNSVVDVLLGKENPSGKLTMTFPITVMDHPSSRSFPLNGYKGQRGSAGRENIDYTLHKEGINIGYRYFNTVNRLVSYPFGYGLSYTEFSYDNSVVKATGEGFKASIRVKNIGKMAGRESVQLYVSAPAGGLEKPACELKAFAKTKLLQPGESEMLIFNVSDYDLASFDESIQSWVSAKGKYIVKFGASIEDIRGIGTYWLSKEFTRKANNVLKPTMSLNEPE